MTFLAAMFLAAALAPSPSPDAAGAAAEDASCAAVAQEGATAMHESPSTNAVESANAEKPAKRKISITINSDKADYDNKSGALLFEGNVRVDGEEFFLEADTGTVFVDGTNDVKAIVAMGNVKIRRESPEAIGTCAKAVFVKAAGRIVMHGDAASPAKLVTTASDKGEGKGGFKSGALEGRRITFWLDSEQVEVDRSTVTIEAERRPGGGKGDGKDDWKKRIIGK